MQVAPNIIAVEPRSPEWHALRMRGLGSTDIAAALGMSRYKTPLELWREKLGLVPPANDNWFMQRGRAMEPVIRQFYADRTGREVYNINGIMQHPEHPFLLASIDGYVDGERRLTEFKTATSGKGWGEEGTDQIPTEYLLQVQECMFVSGFEVTDVYVSIGGAEPRAYEVQADPELQKIILDGSAEFWRKVESRIEPEPVSLEDMQSKFRVTDGASVYATEAIMGHYIALTAAKLAQAEYKGHEDHASEEIKKFMLEAGASVLLDQTGQKLLTWNEQTGRKSIDARALEREEPAIYSKYMRQGEPFRVLRLSTKQF